MPTDTKLDYQLWERERITLLADPTESGVFAADQCQSVQLVMTFEDAATADAVNESIIDGEQSDLSDGVVSTVTPHEYPLANPGASQVVRVIEFVPAKSYFKVSFAGSSAGNFVELVVIKQNCRAPGVGSEKPLVPDGLSLKSITCMVPSDCDQP